MSLATRRRMRNRIGRGLTFEKVWATIERNAEEAEKRHAEWEARWQKETEERHAEWEARWQKEAEERHAEWEARCQKEAEERRKRAEERQVKRKQEAEERSKKAEERSKRAEEQQAKRKQEYEKQKKEYEERQKRTEEQEAKWKQEYEERQKRLDRQMENLDRQMGGLHNSFGEMAEYMVAPGVVDLFNDIGFHITEDVTHNKRILDDKKHTKAQIDLYMGNGDYIIAVEVKTSLGIKDIEEHQRRLEILREHINKTGDRRKILGGMAVAVLSEDDRKAILDAGFYLLEPSGDMMKMDLPEGFVPSVW